MLKRSPSLVEQVKTHLKERIVNLEFDEGRMPSESDLADELKVSRNTIRDALSRLEMEGIIFRKQGAGTFVNEAVLLVKTRLDEIVPYEQLIQEHNYTPSVKLTYVKEEAVDSQIVAQLKRNDEKMLAVQKLFCADEKPVILTHSYIPTSLITKPYHQDDFLKPTYHFLSNFCRQSLAYFLTDIVPLIAPPWLVDQLELPQPQTALLSFQELGFNQENVPIIKATSYFRDELLRLRLMRRPTT
jgi:GntR family transcriptional regulator